MCAVSKFRANLGGHAPGHLREALIQSLERYWAGRVPTWTIALADNEVLSHYDAAFQRSWDRWPAKRRARWLLGQLHNCTDIMASDICSQLELPQGSTVARAIRKLRSELEEDVVEKP